jgi:hypothetical protein
MMLDRDITKLEAGTSYDSAFSNQQPAAFVGPRPSRRAGDVVVSVAVIHPSADDLV